MTLINSRGDEVPYYQSVYITKREVEQEKSEEPEEEDEKVVVANEEGQQDELEGNEVSEQQANDEDAS